MSYEQRKTNRQKREKRYKIMMLTFICVVVIVFVFSLINKNTKTIIAQEETYSEEVELQGVVIKDEKVFKLSNTKDIDTSTLEGKKVPVGTQVGNATLLNDLTLLKEELKEIKGAIATLKKTNKDEVFKNDKTELVTDYNKLVESLQEKIYNKDYKDVERLKNEIVLVNKKLNDLMPQNNLIGQSIESLNDKKEAIEKEINQKDSSYTTKLSGILSYKVDGYENIFKAQGFENYVYDKLSLPDQEINENGEIKLSDEFNSFKIINNFEWYLALKVENRKDINSYEVGDLLDLKYSLKDNDLELQGKIISINNTSNKSVIILKFNKHLHDFYNARFPKINLIEKKIQGLKIPSSVIIEQDDEKGVYIKDFSGIVKYRPIKIIATKGDNTYIDKGDENLLIKIDAREKEARTVSIYDEILLKPNKFKEGQILD